MEIVVTGRNVEVPEHFRVHVGEKLARLERYDHKIVGMEVELFHERNRRQAKSCQRVEITGRGCGPVARAEACGPDFYAALDSAIGKLEARLRRAHDRRRVPYGRRPRGSVRTLALAGGPASPLGIPDLLEETPPAPGGAPRPQAPVAEPAARPAAARTAVAEPVITGLPGIPSQRGASDLEGLPGQVVRHKEHTAEPMSIDEALSRMELVGHDFYLFSCEDTGLPSVVYRRRGYDYGLIRLAEQSG